MIAKTHPTPPSSLAMADVALGATAGLSSSAPNTVGQANRGTPHAAPFGPSSRAARPSPPQPADADPTDAAPFTLLGLFLAYRWRILLTYGLFNLENLVLLLRPCVVGLAISGLVAGTSGGLVLVALQHMAFLSLSVARQMYDTRAFTRVYSDLAIGVARWQRSRGVDVSRMAARSALSREIVSFFEFDVPRLLHSAYAVVGALVMLGLCDGWLVPLCLLLLLPTGAVGAVVARRTHGLNSRLNNQLEREVEALGEGGLAVRGHYEEVARWRIRLSDCQAWNFGLMNLFVAGLIVAVLARSCAALGADAGRIVAVFGYATMYVVGLGETPALVQQIARLRDIQQRLRAAE